MKFPQPHPPPDAFGDEHYVGYYHISFDLTNQVSDLVSWLNHLKNQFDQAIIKQPNLLQPLNILLEPMQQMIGDRVYEVMFIADSDGLPLEFIRIL